MILTSKFPLRPVISPIPRFILGSVVLAVGDKP